MNVVKVAEVWTESCDDGLYLFTQETSDEAIRATVQMDWPEDHAAGTLHMDISEKEVLER